MERLHEDVLTMVVQTLKMDRICDSSSVVCRNI